MRSCLDTIVLEIIPHVPLQAEYFQGVLQYAFCTQKIKGDEGLQDM